MAKNKKTRKSVDSGADTLELTKRSIKATGIRTTVLVVTAAVILGITYIFVSLSKPNVTNFISGNNGIAIGQARNVTVDNGQKESE